MAIDSLIMGIRDADALRKNLDIPQTQHVVAAIAIGKGAVEMKRPVRKELDKIAKFI